MGMSAYMASLRERVGNALLEVPSVTIVLRDAQGRVLLVEHADTGEWTLPGGAIEPLETPANAAVREMWEETGVHVKLTRLVGVFGGDEYVVHYSNGDRTSYVTAAFEAEAIAGEPRPDGEETLAVRFLSPDDDAHAALPRWVREVIDAVVRGGDASFRAPDWAPPGEGR